MLIKNYTKKQVLYLLEILRTNFHIHIHPTIPNLMTNPKHINLIPMSSFNFNLTIFLSLFASKLLLFSLSSGLSSSKSSGSADGSDILKKVNNENNKFKSIILKGSPPGTGTLISLGSNPCSKQMRIKVFMLLCFRFICLKIMNVKTKCA